MNKFKITFITFFLFPLHVMSQQLNMEETLKYIENIKSKFPSWPNSSKRYSVSLSVSHDGIFTLSESNLYNDDGEIYTTESIHVDDLSSTIEKKKYSDGYFIVISCKNDRQGCFSKNEIYRGRKKPITYGSNLMINIPQEYEANKLKVAFEYLISLLKEKDFNRDADDPFANSIAQSDIIKQDTTKSNKIKLTENNGGTYSLNVMFDSISQTFVLDSGAAETSITDDLERKLIQSGQISKSDYLPSGLYKIADGSIIYQRRILLKKLKVGQFTVKKVIVSVGNNNSSYLLGRSFLNKFSSWSVDNQEKRLELQD